MLMAMFAPSAPWICDGVRFTTHRKEAKRREDEWTSAICVPRKAPGVRTPLHARLIRQYSQPCPTFGGRS